MNEYKLSEEESYSEFIEEEMWNNRPMRFSQEFFSEDEYDDITRDGFEDWEDDIYDKYNGFFGDVEINMKGDPIEDLLDVQMYEREMEIIHAEELMLGGINTSIEITEANIVQSINNLLGKFKVYYINEIDHPEFLENNDYLELNLLSPDFESMEMLDLIDAGCFDVYTLKKYDQRVNELCDPIRNIFKNLTIPRIVDLYNVYLEILEEDIL